MPKGLIISLDAEPKSYKTSTILSAPLPLAMLCYDLGYERAIYGIHGPELLKDTDFDPDKHIVKFAPGIRESDIRTLVTAKVNAAMRSSGVTIFECPLPPQERLGEVKGMKEVFDYSRIVAGTLMSIPELSSIGIDTATLMRSFGADAHLQQAQENARKYGSTREQLTRIEYGRVNDDVRDFYNSAKATGKNYLVVHHMVDEFVKTVGADGQIIEKESGRRVPHGVVDRDRYIDIAVELSNKGTPKAPKPVAKFTLCGYNETLIGDEVANPTWNRIVGHVEVTLGDRIKFTRRE